MALRQRISRRINQENTTKFVTKSVRPELLLKRKALAEVRNRLPNFQKNIIIKKNGALPERKQTRSLNAGTERPSRIPQLGSVIATTAALSIGEAMETSDMVTKPVPQPRSSVMDNIHAETKVPRRHCSKSYSSRQLDSIDPDECSKNDPAMVCEYVEDIFSYLRSMEKLFPIRNNFLEGHETSPRMRKILISWIVEVHMNFKMLVETLHLCIAIIDRYLQGNRDVGRGTLQLVGISSLLVAAKYEETYIPPLSDFVYVCDNTYSKKQILSMEIRIVKQLDCSFGQPLSVHFLRRYNKVARVQGIHHTLGKFLLELALLESEMSYVNPSLQAAAVCCVSMGIVNGVMDLSSLWTPTLVRYTKYEYSEVKNIIVNIVNILVASESPKFQKMTRQKYASSSNGRISLNPRLNGPLVRKLTAA